MTRPPVLIVGAGPVGLAAANLLSAREVPVVLVERNTGTSDEAKAISLDDESLRTLEAAQLAQTVLDVVVPGTGTRYFDRRGQTLFHAGGPEPYRLGYPFKNQFAQPELERVLLQALRARPRAEVRFGTELTELHDTSDGVTVRLAHRDGRRPEDLTVSWVLGCDGGRSTVRALTGISMEGTSHREVWLVVDTSGDSHDERYSMHFGLPDRPTVIVPGRDGHCRYEFRLREDEGSAGEKPEFALIHRLVGRYRDITPEQVERATNYTFNALVADRWRIGHTLILGDAAHMMPPFAGQGLNSGIRDVANLVWKLAEVWQGRAAEALLDTYESERRPHAAAMVAFSERLGRVVMTVSASRARLRDAAIRVLLRTGRGRRYLSEMRFRPSARHHIGMVTVPSGASDPMVGTLMPQPRVLVAPELRAQPLDRVLGDDFALLGIAVTQDDWALVADVPNTVAPLRQVDVVLGGRLPRMVGSRLAVADADGRLEAAFSAASGAFVLVKPDRYIAAVVPPNRIAEIYTLLATYFPVPTSGETP